MGAIVKPAIGILVALLILLGAGCGGDNSSTVADSVSKKRPYPWLKGPSRQFLVPGGDNVVQTFGEEAANDERKKASQVVAQWMKARAAQDWRSDCSYLSEAYKHSLVATDARQVTSGRVTTCPAALAYFGHLASGSYRNNFPGLIDSLRVGKSEGDAESQVWFAYAQYHGNDGKDWVIPLEREGTRWKIAKAAPIDRMH